MITLCRKEKEEALEREMELEEEKLWAQMEYARYSAYKGWAGYPALPD